MSSTVMKGATIQKQQEHLSMKSYEKGVKELSRHPLAAEDYEHLQIIHRSMEPLLATVADTMEIHYQQHMVHCSVTKKEITDYISLFFGLNRNQAYVNQIYSFYTQLRDGGLSLNQAIIAFHKLPYSCVSALMTKASWRLTKKNELYYNSLQKAVSLELDLIISVYINGLTDGMADGITSLVAKNGENSHIRHLLIKMEQQHDLSQNVAAASEQLASSIDEVARTTTEVAELTCDAVEQMNQGRNVITSALNEIIQSDRTFDFIANRFNDLKESLEQIEHVVSIIDSIANQTHLLALNASIEAARAGEAGLGFAVVATEIRKLASTTQASLQEVYDKVMNVNQLTSEVADSIQDASAVVKKGVLEADDAIKILSSFSEKMNQVNEATTSIAAITQEQAASVDDTTQHIVEMADVTEDVSALVHQTGRSLHELIMLTEELRGTLFVKHGDLSFRTMLQLAKTDHIFWKSRIYNMLLGYKRIMPEHVLSHHDCMFGQWYEDEKTRKEFGHLEAYSALEKPHRLVHENALIAVQAYQEHDYKKVEMHLRLIEEESTRVVKCLDRLIDEMK